MNERICKYLLCLLIAAGSLGLSRHSAQAQPPAKRAIDIGTRVEMFVDDQLIDPARRRGISLELQTPVRREVVLTTDKPWEGIFSAYFTILQDGPKFRLYYRGSGPVGDSSEQQYTCYAESTDGIHFVRPNLGLHEFEGSKDNNIILSGLVCHNFSPFLDTNPAAKPDEHYKALAGQASKLDAYGSPDGLHWKKLQAEPVITKGTFDSLNLAFWDTNAKCYRAYSRYFDRGAFKGLSVHSELPIARLPALGRTPTKPLCGRRAEGPLLYECHVPVSWCAAPLPRVSHAVYPRA